MHVYTYIYVYIYACVCARIYVYMCTHRNKSASCINMLRYGDVNVNADVCGNTMYPQMS